jgi:hypothetical protein
VIGANGSGKSNLLRFFKDVNTWTGTGFRLSDGHHPDNSTRLMPHWDRLEEPSSYYIERESLPQIYYSPDGPSNETAPIFPGRFLEVYTLDAQRISLPETVRRTDRITADGTGTACWLDNFKTGADESVFAAIEQALRDFIPEALWVWRPLAKGAKHCCWWTISRIRCQRSLSLPGRAS